MIIVKIQRFVFPEECMSKISDSLRDSIINRKFSNKKIKKTCWNCGHEWQGLQRSFCPRCLGGRLKPENFKKV